MAVGGPRGPAPWPARTLPAAAATSGAPEFVDNVAESAAALRDGLVCPMLRSFGNRAPSRPVIDGHFGPGDASRPRLRYVEALVTVVGGSIQRCNIGWLLALTVGCGSVKEPGDSGLSAGPIAEADGSADTSTESITDPCLMPIAVVELGTGDFGTTFRAINTGDPITLANGERGVWYIYVAAIIRSPTPFVSVHATVWDAAGNQLAGSTGPVYLELVEYDSATCVGATWGLRAPLLDYSPPVGGFEQVICDLEGQALTIQMDVVELETGAAVSDTMLRVAALDPLDVVTCY